MLLQIPNNGIIFEIRSSKCCDTVAACEIKLQNWDLCRYTNGSTDQRASRRIHPGCRDLRR